VLVEIQGKPVADPTAMLNVIAALEPGSSAKVKLKRQNQDVDTTINVGRRPKPQPRAE
jgi:serine protease DegQ